MTSGVRYNSGRGRFVGYGSPVPYPITLDPTQYEGAVVYASDREVYYSDGEDWVVISGAPIRRPFALIPTNAFQRRQLRLSAITVAAGLPYTQVAILFRVSLNEDMSNPVIERLVETTTGNSLTLNFGELPSNQAFYWQGKYIATDNQESQFSTIATQVFPDRIETPIPIGTAGETTLALRVSPYESAFLLPYGYTVWEVYPTPSIATSPLLTEQNTATSFSLGELQATLLPGSTYYWRARFNDNTTLTSAWSDLRQFVMDSAFRVRSTSNVAYFVGRTIPNSIGTPYTVPAEVLDSTNTPYTCI
jgi:hypothetical protein